MVFVARFHRARHSLVSVNKARFALQFYGVKIKLLKIRLEGLSAVDSDANIL